MRCLVLRNSYSLSEMIKNVYSLIMTKIFFPRARFVRRPIYIRGQKSLIGGRNLITGRFCRFDLDGNKKTLFIGDNCEFGDMTHIVAYEKVKIGNDVLIASKVFISDTNHGNYSGEMQDSPATKPNERFLFSSAVNIGARVWIGENVVILAGSHIGDGCIIGANSVVKDEWPNDTILAGIPARALKKWDKEQGKWVSHE